MHLPDCHISLSNVSFAQENKFVGRVLDSQTQKPLKDVNIIISGTFSGTISNYLGFFELTLDTSKFRTLEASHVGYKTAQIQIPKEVKFKFFLERELTVLNRIYVNRYPKDLTDKHLSSTGEFSKNKSNTDGLKVVESNADFPGGMDNFYTIIGNSLVKNNSQIPDKGFDIVFTVGADGHMTNVGISDTTLGFVFSEITRTFQEMPAWIPGTQRGNNVSQDFKLPIRKKEPVANENDMHDFYEFIGRNIRYPIEARRIGIEGRVFTEMTLDSLGKILDLTTIKDIGGGCGDEVIRILKELPLNIRRKLVNESGEMTIVIPIRFSLDSHHATVKAERAGDSSMLNEIAVVAVKVNREAASPSAVRYNDPFHYVDLKMALTKPNKVKKLSLIDQKLESFPVEILALPNLVFLDMEKNLLKELPGDIQSLAKLQELFFYENRIEALPSGFANLKQLKTLGLGSNHLKEFPMDIIHLETLESLDLSGNQISSIPVEIGKLKNLTYLVLQNNNIKNIPVELYNLTKLKNIFLQGNPIDPREVQLLREKLRKTKVVF